MSKLNKFAPVIALAAAFQLAGCAATTAQGASAPAASDTIHVNGSGGRLPGTGTGTHAWVQLGTNQVDAQSSTSGGTIGKGNQDVTVTSKTPMTMSCAEDDHGRTVELKNIVYASFSAAKTDNETGATTPARTTFAANTGTGMVLVGSRTCTFDI